MRENGEPVGRYSGMASSEWISHCAQQNQVRMWRTCESMTVIRAFQAPRHDPVVSVGRRSGRSADRQVDQSLG